jgi:hypothetical protein
MSKLVTDIVAINTQLLTIGHNWKIPDGYTEVKATTDAEKAYEARSGKVYEDENGNKYNMNPHGHNLQEFDENGKKIERNPSYYHPEKYYTGYDEAHPAPEFSPTADPTEYNLVIDPITGGYIPQSQALRTYSPSMNSDLSLKKSIPTGGWPVLPPDYNPPMEMDNYASNFNLSTSEQEKYSNYFDASKFDTISTTNSTEQNSQITSAPPVNNTYNITVNASTNASPDEIARTVEAVIKRNQSPRGVY